MLANLAVNISKAASHEIGSNSPAPRSVPGLRNKGCDNLAGESCFIMAELPLAQSTPLFTGWSGLPCTKRIFSSSKVTLIPQRQAHI